jgi:hypothetical protein
VKPVAFIWPIALVVATAGCFEKPQGRVLKAGKCTHVDRAQYRTPDSATGFASLSDLNIVDDNTHVPLAKGAAFGMQWEATGMPARTSITFVVQNPMIRRPDGSTMMGSREEIPKESDHGRIESTDCYVLSEDYEVEPGDWTLSVMHGSQVLVTQTFRVGT